MKLKRRSAKGGSEFKVNRIQDFSRKCSSSSELDRIEERSLRKVSKTLNYQPKVAFWRPKITSSMFLLAEIITVILILIIMAYLDSDVAVMQPEVNFFRPEVNFYQW